MVPTERVLLQFFILILFTINGLHSYPRHHPSLGILNKLIDQDSNSPLIVVVDSNNQARTLDDEWDSGQEQRKGRYIHNPGHHAAKFSEREYENNFRELLRANERMPEKQEARTSQNAVMSSFLGSKTLLGFKKQIKSGVEWALGKKRIKDIFYTIIDMQNKEE